MTVWRKSSHSGSDVRSDCVELAALSSHVGVRDSKNPDLGNLRITRAGFAVLAAMIKNDRLAP